MRMASRTSSASGRLSSASRRFNRFDGDTDGMLRDGEKDGGSFSKFGFDPDSSAIAINHAFANCEANAGATVFLVAMETFENTKDFLLVLRFDTDTVVLNGKAPRDISIRRGHVNSRRVFPPILKRIGDEILEHLL